MTRYGESLAEWADLHGEHIPTAPAPVEHCDRHGPWVARFGCVDECPACTDAYDRMARADAWHDYHTSTEQDDR